MEQLREHKEMKGRHIEYYIKTMISMNKPLDGFDEKIWLVVVDTVTVKKDGSFVFKFMDGSEIQR